MEAEMQRINVWRQNLCGAPDAARGSLNEEGLQSSIRKSSDDVKERVQTCPMNEQIPL